MITIISTISVTVDLTRQHCHVPHHPKRQLGAISSRLQHALYISSQVSSELYAQNAIIHATQNVKFLVQQCSSCKMCIIHSSHFPCRARHVKNCSIAIILVTNSNILSLYYKTQSTWFLVNGKFPICWYWAFYIALEWMTLHLHW